MAAHPVDVVDVLDIDRALLHARPAVRARPQHVRVDHPVLLLLPTSGRPASAFTASGSLSRCLVGGGEQVGGLGEGVVAQVQDDLLGGQRLAGRPGRALGLAPAALGAGAHVQQALPGEVLDLPQPEHVGVRVGLLEVQHLPVAAHRLQRRRARSGRRENSTFSGASAMCRCLEYTTITANAMTTAIWASRNTASSTLLTPTPSGCSQCPTIWDANAPCG